MSAYQDMKCICKNLYIYAYCIIQVMNTKSLKYEDKPQEA